MVDQIITHPYHWIIISSIKKQGIGTDNNLDKSPGNYAKSKVKVQSQQSCTLLTCLYNTKITKLQKWRAN